MEKGPLLKARNFAFFACYLLLSFTTLWTVTGQRPGGRREKSRLQKQMDTEDDFTLGFWVIGVIIFLLFVPTIISFCIAVVRDPLTPDLIKNGSELLKEKTMGFLSDNKKKGTKKSR